MVMRDWDSDVSRNGLGKLWGMYGGNKSGKGSHTFKESKETRYIA